MEGQLKSKTSESLWQICGMSLSNTGKHGSRGERTRCEEREEIYWYGVFFPLFVCLSWFGFITTERSTRSKFILYVGKGEERMLKLKLFALSPAPVLDMW